ncbi:MAG: hypothetical protein ACRDAM_20810 [Casimicrobium sp.]
MNFGDAIRDFAKTHQSNILEGVADGITYDIGVYRLENNGIDSVTGDATQTPVLVWRDVGGVVKPYTGKERASSNAVGGVNLEMPDYYCKLPENALTLEDAARIYVEYNGVQFKLVRPALLKRGVISWWWLELIGPR